MWKVFERGNFENACLGVFILKENCLKVFFVLRDNGTAHFKIAIDYRGHFWNVLTIMPVVILQQILVLINKKVFLNTVER
jgi:hypothetical protein